MIYGYARCSTNEERQDIDRQKRELYTLGVTDNKYIYWEYESGTNDNRAELQKLMDTVSEGDTIATTEVSRLTRSTKHLCEILQIVKEKKLILDIPVEDVLRFEKGLFEYIDTKYPEIPESIRTKKVMTEEVEETLKKAISEFKKEF